MNIRRVGKFGRVVIPKDIREHLGWEAGCPLTVSIVNDAVVVKKNIMEARPRIASEEVESERIRQIRKMIEKGYSKKAILDLDYTEEEYMRAWKSQYQIA